ncbi:MAG: bifunctional riboflavin kinase/FMN adenylyltransferase [Planctomycetota bacterium]|jgi:riboflavin kinase/FMN adenylyltransferase
MVGGTALTIGNFDGVHSGHATLVAAARAAVGPSGRVVVLSFDPHPVARLRPGAAPGRLTRFGRRVERLRAAGADEVVRLEPTDELLATEPRAFIEQVVAAHRPRVLVEGPDFRFGRGRAGSVAMLRDLEGPLGFRLEVIDPVEAEISGQLVVRVSSSMIRWLLDRGRVRDAGRLLGRPVELDGEVVPGDRRGRAIGVPTANLDTGDLHLPADGIYAGRAERPDGTVWPAAISVGTKPTFGDNPRVCEAHLIGYPGPLDDYGWTIRLELADWLRAQLAYRDVDALVEQLHRDIDRCRAADPQAAGCP